jgi:hypothetical protein
MLGNDVIDLEREIEIGVVKLAILATPCRPLPYQLL